MAEKTWTIEDLEALFQRPVDQRTSDHHTFLYEKIVALEAVTPSNAKRVHVLLLKSRAIGEMEPKDYGLAIGEEKSATQASKRTGHNLVEIAFEVTDQARALAVSLQDKAAQGRVYLLRGQLYRRLGNFPTSAAAYRTSATVLEDALKGLRTADSSLVRDLLEATIKLVSLEYLLGRFDEAQQSLDDQVRIAQQMIPGGDTVPFDEETVKWLRALLARAQGKPLEAFINATSAADTYLNKEPSISLVRVLWVATEVALDLAEAAKPDEPSREEYLKAVYRYGGLTKTYAAKVIDPAGIEMAKLSDARLRQVESPTTKVATNQVRAALERIEKDRDWDLPLKVDAYITLGRILTIRELIDEAREAFEQAVHIANENNSPGMAWFATEALKAAPQAQAAPVAVAVGRGGAWR